jgi:hypothetical protein
VASSAVAAGSFVAARPSYHPVVAAACHPSAPSKQAQE